MNIQLIEESYLLALYGVSVYMFGGAMYLDRLWAHDLRQHVEYIPDLTLFCYLEQVEDVPASMVRIADCPLLSKVKIVCIPKPRNTLHALRMLPQAVRLLWNATRGKTVVHSGVAGWPIPTAWLLLPMQVLRGFFSVIVVESADWRSLRGKNSWARRLWRAFHETVNRWCVRCAHLPVFTHSGYRDSMLGRGTQRGIVIPAAWVNETDILDEATVQAMARARQDQAQLRLVYAGRLTEQKGIQWLVQALVQRQHAGRPIRLDVFGSGPLEDWLRRAQTQRPDLHVRFMGTVTYGEPFFSTIRDYDALVLPTFSDEQPRILFDAYSQGLPVLGSVTDGTREYLLDGEHGATFAVGDEAGLYDALRRFESARPDWAELASNCLASARRMTHVEMHRARAEAINAALRERAKPAALHRPDRSLRRRWAAARNAARTCIPGSRRQG